MNNEPLGGGCLNLNGDTVTVNDLKARGLSEQSAREVYAFAQHLKRDEHRCPNGPSCRFCSTRGAGEPRGPREARKE